MTSHTRYVAHIDILGFTSLISKNPHLAWEVLSSLAFVRDDIAKLELEFTDTGERARLLDHIHSVMFSDTIVLFTKSDSILDLRLILLATTEIFHKAMCKCVPVRAGIAHGTFFFNLQNSMYAGPALVEAYKIGEDARWLGIVTSERVYNEARMANIKSGSSEVVITANIPIEGGLKNGFAVNWPAVFAHDFTVKMPIPCEVFYAGFADAFGIYQDLPLRVRLKYENTVAFINSLLTPKV